MSILKTALGWYLARMRAGREAREARAGNGLAPEAEVASRQDPTDPTSLASLQIMRGLFPQDARNLRRVFQDGPPPSLDGFDHKLSNVPPGAKLKAWSKIRETERRLAVAVWAMWRTAPETGQHRVLAEDLVGAFFYSFEAAVQVLKEETKPVHGKQWFEPWLAAHPNSTVTLRGIRTLRTLAVHVEDIRTGGGISISVGKGRGGTITRHWRLPKLNTEALRSLDRPKLRENELDAWEKLRTSWGAGYLMEQGLTDLRQIVFDAEQLG